MKLVAGLGNPGSKYKGTRHNVGFEIVDELARRHGLTFDSSPADAIVARWRERHTLVVKPLTFMNLSGQAVGELARYFKIDPADTLVIVDEVQLPLGRLRFRARGSAGGHNGLRSIEAHLERTSIRGCASASDGAMDDGISPITSLRASNRTNGS